MKKAVLFDMDGVIVKSEEVFLGLSCNYLCSKGVRTTPEEMKRYIGSNQRDVAADMVQRYQLPMTVEECRREVDAYSGNTYLLDNIGLIEGVVPFLRLLQGRGLAAALVSSSASRDLLTVLNRFHLHGLFGAVVPVDLVQNPKPAPDGYLRAAELLGVSPAECVVVEDSATGIRAGKNAGMLVVGFKGGGVEQDVSGADRQAGSFAELERKLDDLLS
ncbi:HAD family phosphatase [Ruminococcaceae bacterium OttesenSCG-928-I18]|nr:HAD family phosphatase [Ruminococcaceae bacterium OttesenSCG-928-I18]